MKKPVAFPVMPVLRERSCQALGFSVRAPVVMSSHVMHELWVEMMWSLMGRGSESQ